VLILNESYDLNKTYFKNASYVEWLESFTIDERESDISRKTYHKLIRTLWAIPFTADLGNDIDRAKDGIELRSRYNDILAEKAGDGDFIMPDVHEIFGPCRVLEMLIALTMNMYDIMLYTEFYDSISTWFWEIMGCLGFDLLDDISWIDGPAGSADLVNRICEDVMEHRDVLTDGTVISRGGWFGVEGWSRMEIWYQMHAFLGRYF